MRRGSDRIFQKPFLNSILNSLEKPFHGAFQKSFSKRAFILSLDIAVASFIVIIILVAAHQYIVKSEEQKLTNLQMVRTGSDMVALMQHDGTLAGLNKAEIEESVNALLPSQYSFFLRITSDDGDLLAVGGDIPHDQFVGSGKRYFLIDDGGSLSFGRAEYFIWRRQR